MFFYLLFSDPNIPEGARSEVQESAITIALLMFGIILERFITILKETLSPGSTVKNLQHTPVITLGGDNVLTSTHADIKHSTKAKSVER